MSTGNPLQVSAGVSTVVWAIDRSTCFPNDWFSILTAPQLEAVGGKEPESLLAQALHKTKPC